MLSQELIFSDKRSHRLKRHVIFWSCWWIYFAATHAANPFGHPEISYFRNPVFTLTESVFLLLAQMPLAYLMLYFILPAYILKKKYFLAVLFSIIFWSLGAVFHHYLIAELFPKTLSAILPERYLINTKRMPSVSFFMAVLANFKGAFTITGIALFIKFAKYWYLKELRNNELLKENTEAQLQLLTAQIHPHFLFNTLNNIYSKAQLESPGSAKMILELSHIMRYILEEGRMTAVPLENELQLLKDYINLEKVRYDNKLDMHISFPEHTGDRYIAPLLLLPFVENCFKHGSSKMIKNPWINLKIELQGQTLVMKLMNGKQDSLLHSNHRKGTGIENVKKRLELLYPGKHMLRIDNEKDVFVVNLSVELTARANDNIENVNKTGQVALAYA